MILKDVFGCDVTASGQTAIEPWNRTMLAFLAHSAETPSHLGDVLRTDPDLAIAQACRGLFSLLLGRRELLSVARNALDLAHSSVRTHGATQRETLYVDALAVWLDGRPSVAVQLIEKVLANWPGDGLAMKISQAVRFVLGDGQGMRRSIERILPAYGEDHPAVGYLLGCHAFTLEEAGDYQLAERQGRRGLELAPDDAWGLHAVAHVYDMTAQAANGIQFLNAHQAGWSHCNNFRYHVWWHLALMYLEVGDTDRVLALYDEEVRRDKTDDYRDIANATSLLMRLELEGINVGDRWEELATLCATRIDDGCLAFADLHYLLALCGGGKRDDALRLIQRIHTDALRNRDEMDVVMRDPALSVAKGLKAFSEGAPALAFANFSAARSSMQLIGGSHAQRDVFERITIEAAIRSGDCEGAHAIIRDRTARRGFCDAYAHSRAEVVEEIKHCSAQAGVVHGVA